MYIFSILVATPSSISVNAWLTNLAGLCWILAELNFIGWFRMAGSNCRKKVLRDSISDKDMLQMYVTKEKARVKTQAA
jgi:hypothetical protein